MGPQKNTSRNQEIYENQTSGQIGTLEEIFPTCKPWDVIVILPPMKQKGNISGFQRLFQKKVFK